MKELAQHKQENHLAEENSPAELPPEDLYRLLEWQTQRYTMDDSSSVPLETAQRLLDAIRFSLGFLHQEHSADHKDPVEGLEAANRTVWVETQKAGALLQLAQRTRVPLDSQSYGDTYDALAIFFRFYDHRFFAHEIPCMLDYQLCVPVSAQLQGVRYIREYLLRLIAENRVLGLFPLEAVERLLTLCYRDYQRLLVNLMEPVLVNAVGLALLRRVPSRLLLAPGEDARLLELLRPWREQRAVTLVNEAANSLLDRLEITDAWTRQYLGECVGDLLPRLRATSPAAWGRLFISGRE